MRSSGLAAAICVGLAVVCYAAPVRYGTEPATFQLKARDDAASPNVDGGSIELRGGETETESADPDEGYVQL